MSLLIPIQYHGKLYPDEIKPTIEEIAGHFDKVKIHPKKNYSLHTEYSVGKRKLNSKLLVDLPVIMNAQKNGVPQLWFNNEWSKEFHNFILKIVEDNNPPKIIEVHPPFNDYCNSVYDFINNYVAFELQVKESFPETDIFIENRCGTIYSGGKFLFSKNEDLFVLSEILDKNKMKLRIVLDIPQLFAAHGINLRKISEKEIEDALNPIESIKHNITGIHLWGKKLSNNNRWSAHIGDLNDYFSGNVKLKNYFLNRLQEIFNDGKRRYFVPEVNSNNVDLQSIIIDMLNVGFRFE